MPATHATETFVSEQDVIAFFRQQIEENGSPDLAGLEEEIIVVDERGKPVTHQQFQAFLGQFITALPDGQIISGPSVHGRRIPVLKGKFAGGDVQPETNTTLVEYAHAPTSDAWGSYAQSMAFTKQLINTAKAHNMLVLGGGVVPTIQWEDMLKHDVVIPNADFIYSWTHMKNGTRPEYCRTVFGTASIHHNLGFNDPERMARYLSTSLRIQPTMIALLGNSPFWNGQQTHHLGSALLSYRSNVQIDYGKIFGKNDGISYLYPDFLIDPDATFASVVNGYLDLSLDRTIVGGKKHSCNGLTMREYLRGYVVEGRTYWPEQAALTMMLREPIVDVRPNFTGAAPRIETRCHDGVSQRIAVSVDAFYRGIHANLGQAHGLMAGISAQNIRHARHIVCQKGLAAPLVHPCRAIKTQRDMACALLSIAEKGLHLRGRDEAPLLAPLWVLAESGRNPAQRLQSVYKKYARNMCEVMRAMNYASEGFADGSNYVWPQRPVSDNQHHGKQGEQTCSL